MVAQCPFQNIYNYPQCDYAFHIVWHSIQFTQMTLFHFPRINAIKMKACHFCRTSLWNETKVEHRRAPFFTNSRRMRSCGLIRRATWNRRFKENGIHARGFNQSLWLNLSVSDTFTLIRGHAKVEVVLGEARAILFSGGFLVKWETWNELKCMRHVKLRISMSRFSRNFERKPC